MRLTKSKLLRRARYVQTLGMTYLCRVMLFLKMMETVQWLLARKLYPVRFAIRDESICNSRQIQDRMARKSHIRKRQEVPYLDFLKKHLPL